MTRKPTSYWDYIRIEELTRLQGGLEADDAHLANDEVMFIAIHQIDELWFKLAIRELVAARNLFRGEMVREQTLSTAVRALSRTTTIFGHASAHFSLMETMTTRDYLGFRDKLSPASGFQSAQLREIEILFGLEDSQRIPLGNEKDYRRALSAPDGTPSPSAARVAERLADTPHLKEAIDAWLFRTPIYGSQPHMPDDERAVLEFLENYLGAHEQEVRRAQSLATFPHQTAEERAKLQERYDREIVSARSYLLAEDVAEFPTGNREVGSHTEEFADEPSQVRAISSAGMLPSPTLAREAVATTHKLDDNHPEVSWHDPAELLPAATDEATLEDSQDASESAALAANDPWITDSEASLNESRSAEASLESLSLHDSNESVNVWSLAEPNAEISNTSKRASLWVRAASWLGRSAGALDRWKTARAETAAARSVDEASVGEDQPIVAELAVASAAVEREESLPRVDVQVDVQVDAQEEALAQDTGDFAGDPTGEAQQETPFYKTAAKQLVGFAALMAIGYGGALMVERYTTQETVSATTPAATEEVVANAPESDEAAREQLERVPSATPIVATSVSASDSIATSASPGGLTFGDDAPTNARTTVLNFAGPIARIEGERLEDGFNVTVFGAVCLDRAFPIAEANAQVDRATVLNGNQEAELFVRFVPGRESAYRVVASGNQLEVSIGH